MRLALLSLFCLSVWAGDNMPPEAEQGLAREIYRQTFLYEFVKALSN